MISSKLAHYSAWHIIADERDSVRIIWSNFREPQITKLDEIANRSLKAKGKSKKKPHG